MRRASVVLALVGALAAPTLGGCGEPAPLASLPAGVSIDVYQSRHDVALRRLEIAVTNASAAPITVTAAAFESEQFTARAQWTARPGGATVHAGRTVDLPIDLPLVECAVDSPAHSVTISFVTHDGREGVASVEPVDRYERLPELRAEECTEQAARSIADLEITGIESLLPSPAGGVPIAMLALSYRPRGDGPLVLEIVHDTVLLTFVDPATGAQAHSLPLDAVLGASTPPGRLLLPVIPARCDPHAVAEDKRGTIFRLTVTTPALGTGDLQLRAPDDVRGAIYDYVAEACGFPD